MLTEQQEDIPNCDGQGGTGIRYIRSHSWQEIFDALESCIPVYYQPSIFAPDIDYITGLFPVIKATLEYSLLFESYQIAYIGVSGVPQQIDFEDATSKVFEICQEK